jgi:hypothetical protein
LCFQVVKGWKLTKSNQNQNGSSGPSFRINP